MLTKKPHILLIDDDEFMLQHFGGKFAAAGFEVVYAHDGAEGLEMATRLKPDIVVCDFRMPVLDGLAFGGRLKAAPETRDIPLIFLTSDEFSEDIQKSLKEMGVAAYLHKSIPFEDMLERVNRVLGRT